MEHRWGARVGVDIPVRITAQPFAVRFGRLTNVSVSGAYIRAELEVRLLTRIEVSIELPRRSKHAAPAIAAYVARKLRDGIGIEWCEFAPPAIGDLLHSLSTRPHTHARRPDPSATASQSRLSPPLLKHGS
jgi:hypothetical protein